MKSILFTTGATVTFRQLIEAIVNYDFIVESIIGNGISRMVVQYGNEIDRATGRNLSREFFDRCVTDKELVELLKLDIHVDGQDTGVVTYKSRKYPEFEMAVFPFSNDICEVIASCDMVVSHAGTGSIVDTLRLGKPLVVVTNDKLMNRHQEEVADELVKMGCCKKMTVDAITLGMMTSCVSDILAGTRTFNKLPESSKNEIEQIIYQELVR